MIRLNLETKNKAQEILKEYLENNASEILANKINNGVKIQKDDKTLLNKKDLNGFMKFASDEARKQTESGASFACIESDAVFGWAMHYFEEDEIVGELYNEDGTKYQSPIPKPQEPKIESPKKVENKQPTLFDLLTENNQEENNEKINSVKKIEEKHEKIEKNVKKTEKIEEKMENNLNLILSNNKIVDKETGEIIEDLNIEKSIHKKSMYKLHSLFEGKIEIQWG